MLTVWTRIANTHSTLQTNKDNNAKYSGRYTKYTTATSDKLHNIIFEMVRGDG